MWGWILLPILLFVLLRWFEYAQTFHPYSAFSMEATEFGRTCEDVYFDTADGINLNAWFFPADADSSLAEWAVLISHGNGGNISHREDLYQIWLTAGFNVFAYDYRGYGRSRGRPSENGTYLDIQAAWAWLRQKGFQPERILAVGESLGGGVSSELAVREAIGGLVLQSAFTSVPRIGAELFPWLPVKLIGTIEYDTIAKLPSIQVPVMVLHSREDTLIPFHHGEELHAAANQPKLLREIRGDHNDALSYSREIYLKAIHDFVALLEASGAQE